MPDQLYNGRVVSNMHRSDLRVQTEGGLVRCRALGKLRTEGLLPGDFVCVRTDADGGCTVVDVLPRKNRFARPCVANVDRMILVVSRAEPATDRTYIDGMCAMCAYMGAQPVLCINKCDVLDGHALADVYTRAGIPCVCISARTGEGLDDLSPYLSDGLVVFAGNSGVGKSSILIAVLKHEVQAVGELSGRIGRGKNTTRHVTLHESRFGALLCDTPGFSTFDPVEMGMTDPTRLFDCFPEFSDYLGGCRYTDCGHTTEEDCAIVEAVSRGDIDADRHRCYVELLAALRQYRQKNPEKFRKNK